MTCPLEGIKVLDFSIAVASPFCVTMLADMGAEVIKVERVQGEAQRLGLPAGMDDVLDTSVVEKMPDTASWMAFNRGKKDLAIDIRTEKGKEIVLKLAKEADVVLQSFRPGVAARLGIGYEDIAKINPKVIYCSFTGYGETGPVAHRAGGDMWSQAMSGIVSLMGYPGGPPSMLPFPAFVPGSDKGAPTRAKAEVWSDGAKFKAAAEKMQSEVAKLDAAAKGGNLDAIKGAMGAVGGACKACHDDFRAERYSN